MNHLTYSTVVVSWGKVYLLVGEWSHSILTCTISLFSASLRRKMYRVALFHMRRSGVLYKITFSEVRTNHTNLLWSVVCLATHIFWSLLYSLYVKVDISASTKQSLRRGMCTWLIMHYSTMCSSGSTNHIDHITFRLVHS